MKCQNCGASLDSGVLFCRECGAKVGPQKRFCRECGVELPAGVKFCPNCGTATNFNIPDPSGAQQPPTLEPPAETVSSSHQDTENQVAQFDEIEHSRSTFFSRDSSSYKKRKRFSSNGFFVLLILAIIILCIGIVRRASSKDAASVTTKPTDSSDFSEIQTNYKIKKGTQYSFMSDEWNVYIATAVSDSIINVEHWDKAMKITKNMSFSDDIGAFKINDSENGFSWVDDEHTAFTLKFRDKNNSNVKKVESHIFTIDINNSDTFKGSDYHESIASYVYTCDDWHTYRAIPLTDNFIKIECWSKASKLDELCFGWDWCVIDVNKNDVEFEWTDDSHTAFTIIAQDTQNKSYWKAPAFVLFKLENSNFAYRTVTEYLNSISSTPIGSKPDKNGYDEQTNVTEHFGNYVFSFPAYWNVQSSDNEAFRAYAETSGKTAMFQALLQPTNYENMSDEMFSDIQDDYMGGFAKGFEEFDIQKTEMFDNGNVKGFFYTFKFAINGFKDNDGWILFSLDHKSNQYFMIGLMETDNTQYTYYGDFIQILNSLKMSS